MLEQAVRQAILELHRRGQGVRAIARALAVSRAAVRDVLRRGTAEVPRLARAEKALDHRDDIRQLLQQCEGSVMRVHEELTKNGLQLSYPALTAFCRRHGIGQVPKLPAGRYDFAPGQEMQHDTSPHDLHLGGKVRRVQTASLVLAYSRMLFFQFYPQFRRFEDKVFLTEALRYMDGACQTCMIDNTHVVVLKGTGAAMIPVPEMAAFAERFGFTFVAHAVGMEGDRRLHGDQGEKLHHVVGNHVAQSAGSIEISAALFDADGFGIGDLYMIDVTAVPDRLEDGVIEAEDHDVLHRLFAQIVIDAVNLIFLQDCLDLPIQGFGRFHIVSERFLDYYPAPVFVLLV